MSTIVTISLGVLGVLIVGGFIFICVNVFLTPGKRFLDDEAESDIPAPQRHSWIDYIPNVRSLLRTQNFWAAVVVILILVALLSGGG